MAPQLNYLVTAPTATAKLDQVNQKFYDRLWSSAQLVNPEQFNTWPTVEALCSEATDRLELGPGLRPRLPIRDTCFVDISQPALTALARHGGRVKQAAIDSLPFDDHSFDLVCALDIIEHVADDEAAVREVARVSRPGAAIMLSTPLHPEYWTPFDEIVGHYRRYPPDQLLDLLQAHDIEVERSAVFGMKPQSSLLLDVGMWFLRTHPKTAMRFYNRLFMPIALRRQRELQLVDGLIDTDQVDEVFLVCRKRCH